MNLLTTHTVVVKVVPQVVVTLLRLGGAYPRSENTNYKSTDR